MANDEELLDLKREVHALTLRVASLESGGPKGKREPPASPGSVAHPGDELWALEGLRARLPDHPSTAGGAVMLLGAVTLPTGAPVVWQQSAGSAGMFETEWNDRASALAALGHPVRLELLRHVLSGIDSTAELAALEALGTTGQLHHHLRQLLSLGWLKQAGRGSYEVPASRVVPLLSCLVAVGG
ncbi:ArsR/SmtB family transcription factor [Demequina aurantiaca]|uniref:ArsR/SmtB family transcription factor n=1 Tax=Demequina aurantiaca TaxID=676200 RepID=UPI003D35096B